jgi:hypothetical protein
MRLSKNSKNRHNSRFLDFVQQQKTVAIGHRFQNLNGLQSLNVLSLKTLRSFHDVELHSLTFLEAAEAIGLDRAEVHEYVFAVLARDKPKTLGIIEPLYSSLFHCVSKTYFVEFTLSQIGESRERLVCS